MTNLSQFTQKYQLSKTLRFELIPQGKTLEHIQEKELIEQDEKRASNYQKMKLTIDAFHKDFIEKALKQVHLSEDLLSQYEKLYDASPERKKEDAFEKEFEKVRESLRKEIVASFKRDECKKTFELLNKKELIKDELEPWINKQGNNELVFDEQFKTFTTYFTGFNENRQNMYSDKEQSTAIAYRVIHENLPKFLDNIKTYNKIRENQPDLLSKMKEIERSLTLPIPLDEIFTLEHFNNVVSQSGIDNISHIIGGKTVDKDTKIKGLNEYVNLFNQTVDKSQRLPKFRQLYKQILSDRTSISFLPPSFKTDQELLGTIEKYYTQHLMELPSQEDSNKMINVFDEIKGLLDQIPTFDLAKIYLRNDTNISNIAQSIFGDYSVIKTSLDKYFEDQNPEFVAKYAKAKDDDARKKLNKQRYSAQDYVSIELLQKALDSYITNLDKTLEISKKHSANCIADYFHTHFLAKKENTEKTFDFISNITAKYSCIKGLLNTDYPPEENLKQNQITIGNIKGFLDSILELLHFVKPLHLKSDSILERDEVFYAQFEPLYEQLNLLTPLYNMVRNYVTQKPYSVEKFKLNFENKGKFLGGWVDSRTENSNNGTQAGGYLLRKKNSIEEYDYFLGISADSKILQENKNWKNSDHSDHFERLNYYQLKSASIYNNSYKGENSYKIERDAITSTIKQYVESLDIEKKEPLKSKFNQIKQEEETPSLLLRIIDNTSPDVLSELRKDEKFKTANNTLTENLHKTIIGLTRVPKSKDYVNCKFNDFMEAQAAIGDLCKEKIFTYYPIDNSEINELQEREKNPLFLFKISNKDLSFSQAYEEGKRKKENRGKDNLHTMYFKAMMEGNQSIYDIGTGELFFRKSSIDETNKVVHKVGETLRAKNPEAKKKTSAFDYEITKDKRYTKDKFFFHLSIIQNYKHPQKKNINDDVLLFLKNNPDVKIIGLDRGERHLIYLSLIDQQGNILEQESLNTIVSESHPIVTPYHTLLDNKEKERANAREEWGTIENIKDLKEGYLSQVVHKIAQMMVEKNAIVVMEDLNFGFKRGRFHVEKQVYQKLEKMLIDKLNYLVLKNNEAQEAGGLFNALQLTNKFESFQKMGKQSGFLFYVPAWNTSKIDPVTGFVDFLKPKYESIEKSKEFFSTFDAIAYNTEKDYFEFAFDYTKFTARADGTKTNWTVCTHGQERYAWNRSGNNGKGVTEKINVTAQLKTLFDGEGIDYTTGDDLKDQIKDSQSKDFFAKIIKLLSITLSMRYSSKEDDKDFILSPVANDQGVFFNSETAGKKLPKDADANGAYHIAKKGLWFIKQLNKAEDGTDLKKVKLAISNKEWLNFVQKPLE